MIRVLRHGKTSAIRNPATGQEEIMTDVTFIEIGRGGANKHLAESQDFLSEVEGEDVGLPGIHVHTQPILKSKIQKYPVGRDIDGFINRTLYSRPQMIQQEGRPPREIDGKPTYFVTTLSKTSKDDVDLRDSNELLQKTNPELFNTQTRATQVRVLEEAPIMGDPEGVLEDDAKGQNRAEVVANQRGNR